MNLSSSHLFVDREVRGRSPLHGGSSGLPPDPLAAPGGAGFVRGSFGLINRSVVVTDGLATFLGVVVSRRPFTGIAPPLDMAQTLTIAAVAAVTVVLTLQAAGAYRVERYGSPRRWLRDIVIGWGAGALVGGLLLAAFAPQALSLTRCLVVWALATLLVMAAGRVAVGAAFARLNRTGFTRRRVAVVGANELGARIARGLSGADGERDYQLVGVFDDGDRFAPGGDVAIAGDIDDLCLLAQSRPVDVIVLAVPWGRARKIFDLSQRIQWISADVVVPFEPSGLISQSHLVADMAGMPMLQLLQHPFKGTQGVVKVIQDYVVALAALVWAAPIMAVAAVAVRVSSEGPILFRQARLGLNGRPFNIYKFRTMTVDPNDDGCTQVVKGDPRVTRVGDILRRTSIDELPQLFNVLKGEMSIVGPRPHVANMTVGESAYTEIAQSYAARHRIKPGITGWAQINGMRGGITTPDRARDGVDLDLYYIKNWSLRLDVFIIVRTFTHHLIGPAVF